MKRLTGTQKLSAVLGAGLLIAAASGSVFAMHTAEERDLRQIEIRQGKESEPLVSPLPTPTSEPTSGQHDEAEFTGAVEVMAGGMWEVGGRTVAVTAATEIKPGLDVGTVAKVHTVQQADGTLWAREIEPARANSNLNPNDNVNSNDDNDNDDHGNGNVNSNDDNGNDDYGNVNSNEDHANSNTHQDNSKHRNGNSNVNSNDDHGNSNDKHSGGGNDQHGGHGNGS